MPAAPTSIADEISQDEIPTIAMEQLAKPAPAKVDPLKDTSGPAGEMLTARSETQSETVTVEPEPEPVEGKDPNSSEPAEPVVRSAAKASVPPPTPAGAKTNKPSLPGVPKAAVPAVPKVASATAPSVPGKVAAPPVPGVRKVAAPPVPGVRKVAVARSATAVAPAVVPTNREKPSAEGEEAVATAASPAELEAEPSTDPDGLAESPFDVGDSTDINLTTPKPAAADSPSSAAEASPAPPPPSFDPPSISPFDESDSAGDVLTKTAMGEAVVRQGPKAPSSGGVVSSGVVSGGAVSSGVVSSGAVSSGAVSSGVVSSGVVSSGVVSGSGSAPLPAIARGPQSAPVVPAPIARGPQSVQMPAAVAAPVVPAPIARGPQSVQMPAAVAVPVVPAPIARGPQSVQMPAAHPPLMSPPSAQLGGPAGPQPVAMPPHSGQMPVSVPVAPLGAAAMPSAMIPRPPPSSVVNHPPVPVPVAPIASGAVPDPSMVAMPGDYALPQHSSAPHSSAPHSSAPHSSAPQPAFPPAAAVHTPAPPMQFGPPPDANDSSYPVAALDALLGEDGPAPTDSGRADSANPVWRQAHPSAQKWAKKRSTVPPRTPRPGVIALGLVLAGFGAYLLVLFLPTKAPLTAVEIALMAEQAGVDEGAWRFTKQLLTAANINAGLFVLLGIVTLLRGAMHRQAPGQARRKTMDKTSLMLLVCFALFAVSFLALVLSASVG